MAKVLQDIKRRIELLFPKQKKKPIQDWDFIFVFQARYKEELEAYFSKIECRDRVHYTFIDNEDEDQVLVLIQMNESIVIEQAHQLKILKKKKKRSYEFDLKTLNKMIYNAQDEKNANYCNYLKFIRSRMLPGSQMIYNQEKYSVFNKNKKDKYQTNEKGELFTPEEELRAKYHFLLNYNQTLPHKTYKQDAYLYPFADIMKHAGFLQLVPIHKNSRYRHIIFGSIKDYVGSNTQTYFDFVSFLQQWLIVPMIIGLFTVLFNIYYQYTADDSPGDFIYAFVVMIWSILFITKWQQNQKWHKVCQQTGYSDQWSVHQNLIDRSQCYARQSRITGQKEFYTPWVKKIQYYFISLSVLFTVLIISLIFMVLSLNARGFIQPTHKFLYFQEISRWAAPGGIFDSQTGMAQIPNLVHVIVTNAFDEHVYRPLAKKFTHYQRHLNPKTSQNSIIIKYFIYEYIITFADLFYIAFVRLDIVGLREQLHSLFIIDIIRRFVAELLIPKISNMARNRSLKGKLSKGAQDEQKREIISLKRYAILQVNKVDYEPFDDYLQIITNFGYLVMISACFPFAPILILLGHAVESVQDKYKIIHIFKRKLPQKYVGMGMWKNITVFLCYTSIITNIMLFAFSSHQIVSFFPKLFETGKDILFGNTNLAQLVQSAVESAVESATETVLNFGSMFNQTIADTLSSINITSTPSLSSIPSFFPSPYEPYQATTPPVVTSFIAPAQQHQTEFITVLFIIEHVFLILFICMRNILSRQECEADLLVKRRQHKRRIKKHLAKDILLQDTRDKLVGALLGQTQQQRSIDLSSFISKISQDGRSTTEEQQQDKETFKQQQDKEITKQQQAIKRGNDIFSQLIGLSKKKEVKNE